MHNPPERSVGLAALLSDSSPQSLGRLQHLERYLGGRFGLDADGLDSVAMRLLLDEYASALAHLRTAARDGGKRIDGAAAAINSVRHEVKGWVKNQEKRSGSTAPSVQPPASQSPGR